MGDPRYMRFSKGEYVARCTRVREAMSESGLDGLLLSEGGDFTYFTGGTRDFSFSRPTLFLLPVESDPIAIVQRFPSENREREIWVNDIRVYDSMLGVPFDILLEAMADAKMTKGRIGAELGYEQRLGMSYHDWVELQRRLPNAHFVDSSSVIWGVRMIKSAEEIGRYRKACRITARAYEALWEGCRAGMTEVEIVETFQQIMRTLGGGNPWSFINSGKGNYYLKGGGPSERRILKGDQVWIDGGCTYKEYTSDFCCSATVGPASDAQRRFQDMVVEVTAALVRAVRPGIKASDLDTLNNAEWEKRQLDYSKMNFGGGRIGHGLGWGSCLTEPPHISAYDSTVLKAGMVFTLEPGFCTEHGCFQAEEDLVVTEDGCEVFSVFDGGRGLRTIEV